MRVLGYEFKAYHDRIKLSTNKQKRRQLLTKMLRVGAQEFFGLENWIHASVIHISDCNLIINESNSRSAV